MRCAEDVLLPAVREDPNAIVLADGFSCRSQIEHGADRKALHIAELLARALPDPEAGATNGHRSGHAGRIAAAAVVGAGLVAGGSLALRRRGG
jgi:hypothetical protein